MIKWTLAFPSITRKIEIKITYPRVGFCGLNLIYKIVRN